MMKKMDHKQQLILKVRANPVRKNASIRRAVQPKDSKTGCFLLQRKLVGAKTRERRMGANNFDSQPF
jgi:hypothetical protein